MERLTHERVNGIKLGYWSAEKKEALITRLAEYENTGKNPEEIREFEGIARKMAERVVELSKQLSAQKRQNKWIPVEEAVPAESGESVLVTVSGRYENKSFENALQLAQYFGSDGWLVEGYPYWDDPEVKAWMHLPEEYRNVTESGGASRAERVEETMHPEWKEKVMQTFLGSRRQ